MNAAVSEFIGAGLLGKLQREDARAAKHGDRYFLTRQLEYFRIGYNACKCLPAHSCGGCTVLYELGLSLNELTAEQREAHKEQCDHEADKAREIAWAEKQAQGTEFGRIREVVRRSKLTREQKAAEEDARKRGPPPERHEARQMGIDGR